MRPRIAALALIVFVLGVAPEVLCAKKGKPKTIGYGKYVVIAVGDFSPNADSTACVAFKVTIWSGDFFDGLVRRVGPSGVCFAKGREVVKNFPDTIGLEVHMKGYWCTSASFRQTGPPLDSDFMRSLRFVFNSQRGFGETPAIVQSLSAYKVPLTETGPDEWKYEATVHLKEVPLTDGITIAVVSAKGKTLGRVTGNLERPFNPSRVSNK